MRILFGLLWMVWSLLRFSLFLLLLFIRPVIVAVGALIAGMSLFVFLFCLLFTRHETTILYAMFGTGMGMTLFLWLYDDLLSRLAPDDYVLIAER
jgi:hypothetical protein